MATQLKYVANDNTDREFPDAIVVEDAMFKVNGAYVCVEPCGGGGHVLGNQHIYIALTGDDSSGNGTYNFPFRTIRRAVDEANTIVAIEGDIFIHFLDAGPYYISETIIINHQNVITFTSDAEIIIPPTPKTQTAFFIGGGSVGGVRFIGIKSPDDFNVKASEPVIFTQIEFIDFTTGGTSNNFGSMSQNRLALAGVSSGDVGIFGCGYNPIEESFYKSLEKITFVNEGNSQIFADLGAFGRMYLSGCSGSTKGLFCGGWIVSDDIEYYMFVDSIEYVSEAITTQFANFAYAAIGYTDYNIGGCCESRVTDTALYGGGMGTGSGDYTNNVQEIDISAGGDIRSGYGFLSQHKSFPSGTSDDVYAIFSGGEIAENTYTDVIEVLLFASQQSAVIMGQLARPSMTHGSVCDKETGDVLFGGGGHKEGYDTVAVTNIDTLNTATFGLVSSYGDLTNRTAEGCAITGEK